MRHNSYRPKKHDEPASTRHPGPATIRFYLLQPHTPRSTCATGIARRPTASKPTRTGLREPDPAERRHPLLIGGSRRDLFLLPRPGLRRWRGDWPRTTLTRSACRVPKEARRTCPAVQVAAGSYADRSPSSSPPVARPAPMKDSRTHQKPREKREPDRMMSRNWHRILVSGIDTWRS
jgi:hypothetical protein